MPAGEDWLPGEGEVPCCWLLLPSGSFWWALLAGLRDQTWTTRLHLHISHLRSKLQSVSQSVLLLCDH